MELSENDLSESGTKRNFKEIGMNRIGTKTIEAERCILRKITSDDDEMMFCNWAKQESVCRYWSGT